MNTWKLLIYFGNAGFIVGMTGNEANAIAILPRGGQVERNLKHKPKELIYDCGGRGKKEI